jgi:HD superfamily phosphohydrolase
MEVRDPIHGAIPVTSGEQAVIDHPFFQRLRGIRQVGFTELAFPGAVHSRYLHSIGVMHLAGRAVTQVLRSAGLSEERRRAYVACVRLAGLLHDLGHAPFSHCTEWAMPPLVDLGVQAYEPGVVEQRGDRRASHEDYTILILTGSSLAQVIDTNFPFTAAHVAALVSREVRVEDDFFSADGRDFRVLLSQVVSSELDVDRMDYLVRDSYFSGADYGKIDTSWLLNNLSMFQVEDEVRLALERRAIYAFDDFMIARYHMFTMVYFHHKSVIYEEMLKRYFQAPDCPYAIPAEVEAYLAVDDVHLAHHLRGASDPWARDIVAGREWKRALELHGEQVEVGWAVGALDEQGIESITASSVGKLSRYDVYGQKRSKAPPIHVLADSLDPTQGVMDLREASNIFERYRDERRIARVYVRPGERDRATAILRTSPPGRQLPLL